MNDEDDRLRNAIHETETKLAAEEEDKSRKAAEMRASIDRHRREQKDKLEKAARDQRMQDLEMVRARKEADELFVKNEKLRRQKLFEEARDLANYHLKQHVSIRETLSDSNRDE